MTKKLILLFFLQLTFCLVAVSQSYLGVKKGVSFSKVQFKDVDPNFGIQISQEPIQGAVTGIFFKIMQERHAGMQFEVNITDKGWTQLIHEDFNYETQLRYLNIYTQTHLALGNTKFRIFLIGGPFLNYLMKVKSSEIPEIYEEDVSFIYNEEDDNSWEVGLGGGGGFVYDSKIGSFQLEAKVNMGLSNILNKLGDTDPEFSRNQGLEICLIYMYALSGKPRDQ